MKIIQVSARVLQRIFICNLAMFTLVQGSSIATANSRTVNEKIVKDNSKNSSLSITGAAAHWVSQGLIKWDIAVDDSFTYELNSITSAEISLNSNKIVSEESLSIPLTPIPPEQVPNLPHLDSFSTFSIEIDDLDLDKLITSQLIALAKNKDTGAIVSATQVQMQGILDQHYASSEDLGLIVKKRKKSLLKLWAPTAQKVELQVYDRHKNLIKTKAMQRSEKGVWHADIKRSWIRHQLYYRYKMTIYHPTQAEFLSYEVIDPYSVSVSANARFSQFVDLDAPDLKPPGWDLVTMKPIHPADISIYEAHIRDFSIADETAGIHRGKYTAFSLTKPGQISDGMAHLKRLKAAGITHLQVNPAADFATVNENFSEQINLWDSFQSLCEKSSLDESICSDPSHQGKSIYEVYMDADKDSAFIQSINAAFRDRDGFNWGYDPMAYGVPEGSYASDPDSSSRILEFRKMVQGVHKLGLRFSLDIVYNHTDASGIAENSILDKLVPGYYHRRHPITGAVETSSCCQNTATEFKMMEKLMIDTMVRWRDAYQVDAFRYDLMGHHMKRNILSAQKALGADVFLYGEGWDFGEVAQNQRGINATQINMRGTGIATFNDRFRDAIRGGGPFDCGYVMTQQGFANGLFVNDNSYGGLLVPAVNFPSCETLSDWTPADLQRRKDLLLHLADRVRVGLVGSIGDFSLIDRFGIETSAWDIDYHGQPAGYTQLPYESINYISKHDNQTLWDINQMKLPDGMSMEDRVRVQKLGLAMNTLAQGVPFFHMGVDILRSKSVNRDSYNSGDWFNKVDFTLNSHNWNIGLPREDKDGQSWPLIREIIAKVPDGPSKDLMESSHSYFQDLLELRYSSPLFRLRTAELIKEKLSFSNTGPEQIPGLVVLNIEDTCEEDSLDPGIDKLMIIFNVSPYMQSFPLDKNNYVSHPKFPAAEIESGNVILEALQTTVLSAECAL